MPVQGCHLTYKSQSSIIAWRHLTLTSNKDFDSLASVKRTCKKGDVWCSCDLTRHSRDSCSPCPPEIWFDPFQHPKENAKNSITISKLIKCMTFFKSVLIFFVIDSVNTLSSMKCLKRGYTRLLIFEGQICGLKFKYLVKHFAKIAFEAAYH